MAGKVTVSFTFVFLLKIYSSIYVRGEVGQKEEEADSPLSMESHRRLDLRTPRS